MQLSDFTIDARVRYQGMRGYVTLVGRKYVHVKMDTSGLVRRFLPEELELLPVPKPHVYDPSKPLSTRVYAHAARERMRTNARQRRLLSRNGPASRDRMSLPLISTEPGVMIPTVRQW